MLFPEKSGLYKLAVVKLERYNCPHFQSLHVNFKCLWSSHLVLASVYTIRLLYGHLGAGSLGAISEASCHCPEEGLRSLKNS